MIAIFMFYNYSTGIQRYLAFSKDFKHCNTIIFDENESYQLDMDKSGYIVKQIPYINYSRLGTYLKKLRLVDHVVSIVCVAINERKNHKWTPFLVRSCNEICRYTAGIDVGFTFNPIALYKKLLKYDGKRNYSIITSWSK